MDTKRAVIYARFSSSRQREESIEGQVRECKYFAEHEGYTILNVYADHAISGRTDERPQFQQMIEDSHKGLFQYIIVYTFDRFSRESYVSAMYKHLLKKNGVRVISAKERTDDSPAGVLMERVFEGFAEYYSLELAQKVKRGLKENALKGKWTSGPVPFGYKRGQDKKLEQDPNTIIYLKQIFEMAANDDKFSDIANYLNRKGVKTTIGGEWNKNSFRRLLTNPVVIGVFRWDDVYIENYIEPIISKDVFDKVQTRFKQSTRRGIVNVRKSEEYVLTPNIYCGKCGSPMRGISGTSKNRKLYYYYECSMHRAKKNRCSMPSINRDELEDAIYDKVHEIMNNPENVRAIAQQLLELCNSKEDTELRATEKRLSEAKLERERGIDAVLNGLNSPALAERIKSLDTLIETLQIEIDKLKMKAQPIQLNKEAIVYFLTNTVNSSKKRLLQHLVRDVTIKQKDSDGNYHITVRLNYAETPMLSNSINLEAECSQDFSLVKNCRIFTNFLEFSFILNPRLSKKRSQPLQAQEL